MSRDIILNGFKKYTSGRISIFSQFGEKRLKRRCSLPHKMENLANLCCFLLGIRISCYAIAGTSTGIALSRFIDVLKPARFDKQSNVCYIANKIRAQILPAKQSNKIPIRVARGTSPMTARQPPGEKGAKACTIGLYQSRDWYFCAYFSGSTEK